MAISAFLFIVQPEDRLNMVVEASASDWYTLSVMYADAVMQILKVTGSSCTICHCSRLKHIEYYLEFKSFTLGQNSDFALVCFPRAMIIRNIPVIPLWSPYRPAIRVHN